MDYAHDLSVEVWLPRVQAVDAVVNAVGALSGAHLPGIHAHAPTALFAACARQGVRRVVLIFALGANAQAPSAFLRTKHEADLALEKSALDWVILRPSLVAGRDGASSDQLLIGRKREACERAHRDDGQVVHHQKRLARGKPSTLRRATRRAACDRESCTTCGGRSLDAPPRSCFRRARCDVDEHTVVRMRVPERRVAGLRLHIEDAHVSVLELQHVPGLFLDGNDALLRLDGAAERQNRTRKRSTHGNGHGKFSMQIDDKEAGVYDGTSRARSRKR